MPIKLLNTQKIVNLASDPASGSAGEIYFNTSISKYKYHNGSSWLEFSGGGGIAEVSEDLTPALGGNLSASTFGIDDLKYLNFDTNPGAITAAVGNVWWDSGEGGLNTQISANTNITLGQEVICLVYNAEANTLNAGEVVYLFGSQGQRPSVKRASNTSDATSAKTFGMVVESIASGAEGFVMAQGIVKGINTNAYNEGDILWLSDTSGAVTTTKPYAPNHMVFVGVVLKKNADSGRVFVKPQNGYEMDELHNVYAQSPSDNDILSYVSASMMWVKQNLAIAITEVDGSGSGIDADLLDGQHGSYYAPIASPALTGTPTAPTAAADTNTTQVATTAYVVGQASSTNPAMNGSVTVGTSLKYAREDHVHASDTSRAPLASPALTGTPTAPTAAADTNTTQVATTAYVVGQGYLKESSASSTYLTQTNASSTYAPLVSPTFTGTVTVPTPINATDAVTKAYVDNIAQGLHVHAPCAAATPNTLASITGGTVTYNNGTNGVGATLTLQNALTTLDGLSLQNGDRILVKNEATAANNGIYTWATGGTVLTRASDYDTPTEMAGGDFTFVQNGTLYNDTGWVMTDPVTTVGTTAVNFVQFSGAGTYTAGTGLALNGTVFSNTGVLSLAGTTNEITVSASTGSINLSIPAAIARLASPTFTGTPAAPTAAADTNTTQIATTAYVVGQGYAKLASPTFTGTVVLPSTTSIGNVSSTEIEYLDGVTSSIQTQLGNKQPLDADLTAIAAISTTGILKRTGADTWTTITDNSANWDSAYTQRLQWDGGSTNLVAATGRTSLGATTVGGNLFTLTNPSAVTFLRVNADNTVSALNAADFRTAIGAGTSSTTGTVTSVGMTVPTGLSVTPASITTSGTFAVSLASGYVIPTTAIIDGAVATRSTVISTNSSDFNTFTSAGTYQVSGNATWTGSTNGPTSAYGYGQLVVSVNGNIVNQMYYAHSLSGHWVRTKFNAADWTAWQRVWTDQNDGSSSGLDADLLDGQHGSYYATDTAVVHITGAETITGNKSFSGLTKIDSATAGNQTLAFWNGAAFYGSIGTDQGVRGSGTSTDLGIRADTSRAIRFFTGGANERVVIDSSGNVGIGVTSTTYKLEVSGSFAATTKSFDIQHPTKENMRLRYGSLEGPENGVYVRGKTRSSIITLPDYWTGLVDEDSITVQLTPYGKRQRLYVKNISDNTVEIGGVKGEFYYFIQAERKDVDKLVVEYDI